MTIGFIHQSFLLLSVIYKKMSEKETCFWLPSLLPSGKVSLIDEAKLVMNKSKSALEILVELSTTKTKSTGSGV